ncbi:MAG: signal peptidase I [Bacillota bacterium]|nr:signal peptidase I [Bacillota bacterium]
MSKKELSSDKKKTKRKQGFGAAVKEMLIIIAMAVAIAAVIKLFLFDTRIIPTTSMTPTISVNDRIVMSRLSYAFGSVPERGDIVVFTAPEELSMKDDLVKRVIGLPGDTIEIKDGLVYINGEPYAEDYLLEPPYYYMEPLTVPEGCYFMLGDNRNGSNDGHLWSEKFVPLDDIKGKALFCYWPLSRFGSLQSEE